MQNHKKQDKIYVDKIAPDNKVTAVSKAPAGNAGKDAFCLYDHKRHAVGSKIENQDGPDSICTEDGSWKNI